MKYTFRSIRINGTKYDVAFPTKGFLTLSLSLPPLATPLKLYRIALSVHSFFAMFVHRFRSIRMPLKIKKLAPKYFFGYAPATNGNLEEDNAINRVTSMTY